MQHNPFKLRETFAKYFMTIISCCGILLILFHFNNIFYRPSEPIILLLFAAYIFICEYYPIPVWKGNTTLTFPIVATLYMIYGLSWTIIIYAFAVLLVNILSRRPLRILLFNPATLILSFYIAVNVMHNLDFLFVFESIVLKGFMSYSLLLIIYMIVNNLMVDLVLWIRPQTYLGKLWVQKNIVEAYSAGIALLYGYMLFHLGNQRGDAIDFFSFLFFFSPLVGFSLLSAFINRLRTEKNRLKALFTVTSELNKLVPTGSFLGIMDSSFQELINVDAEMLWIKENETWEVRHISGKASPIDNIRPAHIQTMNGISKPLMIHSRKHDIGIADAYFDLDLKSFVYVPLIMKSELVGMLIVGRSRTRSFTDDEVSSIATFANQLSIAIKTQSLIKEKEKRLLLEERNRIAREIHDGVAQSLAGAIMNLETAERKFEQKPKETMRIVSDSIVKLRSSLKEIRESIYALRPYPTERVGLIPAMKKRIQTMEKEAGVSIKFQIRGEEESLSSMVEKILFDVFQESITNSIKHSQSHNIDVLLSYQAEQILLKIKDYGVGFSLLEELVKAKNDAHFGILNMNESIERVNGSLQINSKQGEGTEIAIIIPKMGFEGGDKFDSRIIS
jgi:signal transduction histidine kinase